MKSQKFAVVVLDVVRPTVAVVETNVAVMTKFVAVVLAVHQNPAVEELTVATQRETHPVV